MKIIFVKTGEHRIPKCGEWIFNSGTANLICKDNQTDRHHDIVMILKVDDDSPILAGSLTEILSKDADLVQNLEYSLILN